MTPVESSPERGGGSASPDLSLVMPCYNEEDTVGYTIPKLFAAFEAGGHALEIVAVDNGSADGTGERLQALAERHSGLVIRNVAVNQGYGNGILTGLPVCRAPWVGFIPADGQVDAEDVVRLFEAACASNTPVVAKVRRRFRMDGLVRKIVSVSYNVFVRALWPGLGSIDVNGVPKLLPRDVLAQMELESRGWFLDPELLIKAHYLGVRVLELNVFARMRSAGVSHVRASTCAEFLRMLLYYRFSGALGRWKRERPEVSGVSG